MIPVVNVKGINYCIVVNCWQNLSKQEVEHYFHIFASLLTKSGIMTICHNSGRIVLLQLLVTGLEKCTIWSTLMFQGCSS
jgi:hypothetical protein